MLIGTFDRLLREAPIGAMHRSCLMKNEGLFPEAVCLFVGGLLLDRGLTGLRKGPIVIYRSPFTCTTQKRG